MNKHFPLAPMSISILVLTLVLWLLPVSFLLYSFVDGQRISGVISLFLFGLYGAVWLFCRPSWFRLTSRKMEIAFPVWKRKVFYQEISRVRQISAQEFKQEFGWAMRVGVGGLWGGFGWLWTSKDGFVELYVSRVDGLVLLERTNGNNILITPDNPEKFVASLFAYVE